MDNIHIAESDLSYGSFSESDLFAGELPIFTKPETIAEAGEIAQYTVMGRVRADEGDVANATAGTVTFAGTGNGVLTKASPAVSANVQSGTYKVSLVEVTTDGGKFAVLRPDGTVDGYAIVGTAYDGEVKFTIADGATDFSGLAEFSIPVTIADAPAGKLVKSVRTATDGSEKPVAVMAYAVDTTDGDVVAAVYKGGCFNIAKLVWDASWTTDAQKLSAFEDGLLISTGKLGYSGG